MLKVDDRFIYYLVTKERTGAGCLPTYDSLESALKTMRDHMVKNQVPTLAIPQIGCGLDKLQWNQVVDRLHNVFDDTDIEITVYIYVPPK